MHRFHTLCLVTLLGGSLPGLAEALPDDGIKHLSLTKLEQRLEAVDAELDQLASYSLRSGIGSVGYRSTSHEENSIPEWIQINLGKEQPIDQIVLVPTIWRDTQAGFQADGFPLEFRILTGSGSDTNGTVIASFGKKDHLLPRIAPLVVPCSTTASWIRVEASILSPRAWDGRHTLQFAEILVFNGQENLALRQPVKISSSGQYEDAAWETRFVVDGFLPYLMDAAQGKQSLAFVSQLSGTSNLVLNIDLVSPQPLNRINLHTTDLSDTIPQSTPADFGIPRWLVIEGAARADFSDAIQLTDYRKETLFDVGPIMIRNFPATLCRYVRLTAFDPYIGILRNESGTQIAFAEIELFSNGQNVALNRPVSGNVTPLDAARSFASLTDGLNLYGNILPIREWMEELARRHDLEVERPIITAELTRRYAHQKTNINRLGWLTILLGTGIVCVMLIDRMIQRRAIYHTRERIAADLHDELGANLHAISMLSGIAESSVDNRDGLIETVRRIRALTLRTGAATRLCTHMLEAGGLCEDLIEEMKRASCRLLADLEHDISIQGENHLHNLSPRRRIDLFLFYKECLTNIIRHSGATRVTTQLTADAKTILLEICDNGRGLADLNGNGIPSSLKRRARFLNAQLTTKHPAEGGTCVTLKLRNGFWPWTLVLRKNC